MGQAVTAGDVSSAVGGLWEFNQDFQPLAPFLLAKAQAGKVFLGGIDDQLGEMGQNYANIEMVTELTNLLPQQERQACSIALHTQTHLQRLHRCCSILQIGPFANRNLLLRDVSG